MPQQLDCILIGYNDMNFNIFAAKQKKMAKHGGGYHEVKTNSLFIDEKRLTYMEVMNHYIEKSTGENPRLNVFKAPTLGAIYLKSYLQKRNFQAEVINFFNYGKDRLKELLDQSPLSVAITTTFYIDSSPIIEIVEFIREHNKSVKIIVGGPHIFNLGSDLDSRTLEYMFKNIGANIYIVDSQGEQTLGRVMQQLRFDSTQDLSKIPNVCYFDTEGRLHTNPREVENNNLDENAVDWSYFDKSLVTPITYMRTARSCPFKCTFCNYPTMAGAHVVSNVDILEQELKYLHSIGTTDVVFIDDTFNVPLPRFKRILRMMIKNQFNFRWVSFFRCANADEETFNLMRESGCGGVLLGIESGDQTMLNYMNKAAKLNRYRWGLEQLNKNGIASFVSLICGFPGETKESILNTINFIQETKPTFFNVQLYYHDLRAPIHKKAEQFGIHGAGYNWKTNTMTWQEAAAWAGYMFKAITNSVPLGLLGFSLWGISYLISKGFTIEQIKQFGEITREMLFDSIDDIPRSYPDKETQLLKFFKGIKIKEEQPREQESSGKAIA